MHLSTTPFLLTTKNVMFLFLVLFYGLSHFFTLIAFLYLTPVLVQMYIKFCAYVRNIHEYLTELLLSIQKLFQKTI